MTTDKGAAYLRARAAKDGRIWTVLCDIGDYDLRGDVVRRDECMRTLDAFVFKRIDGVPIYRASDAIAIGRDIARERS